nr:pentatricopeptide repeat-containing protein At4g01400, mitochondrial isoform X2 [Arachis hypogaea]
MTSPSLHRSFLRSTKTLITLSSHRIISFNFSQNPNQQSFYSSRSNSPFESPSRVQKLIASQSDPLLAKEIFECASRHPNFRHSYSTYLILILKLGRSRQFSLVDDLVRRLKSESYPITPTLFSYLIRVYGEADLPDKALKTFYTMLQYGFKPLPKHLNRILAILVSHRNFVRPAFDLFRDAHRHGVSSNTQSYNILMRAFCLNGDVSIAYHLFNKMFKRDIVPDIECYRILMQAMCRKSQVNGAMDLLEDMLNKGEGRAHDACKVIVDMQNNGCLPNVVSYRTLVGGLCDKGMLDEANNYMKEMLSKGFSPQFAVIHGLVKGFCNVGKIKEACGVLTKSLEHGEASHMDTWAIIIPLICEVDDGVRCRDVLEQVLKIEITSHTRIVDAGIGLENYLIRKIRANPRAS